NRAGLPTLHRHAQPRYESDPSGKVASSVRHRPKSFSSIELGCRYRRYPGSPQGAAAMKTFVRCGSLFTGSADDARKGEGLVFDDASGVLYGGPETKAPRRAKDDRLIDHSGQFVMPGLIDVHTHLAYGNAKSEEDIDLYSPMEFRALRGMFFAQKCA